MKMWSMLEQERRSWKICLCSTKKDVHNEDVHDFRPVHPRRNVHGLHSLLPEAETGRLSVPPYSEDGFVGHR